jgi:glutathione S-transferase
MLALYGHRFSSYTWKALIPLYANDTRFEFREIGPDAPDHTAFVRRVTPAGKFPVLTDGDTIVIEATAIIEYLALHHPGSARLIPRDAAQAVTARMLDRVFDNYVMFNMMRVVTAYIVDRDSPDPGEVEAAKAGLRHAYAWLENWLTGNDLPPHVSLVTCAAAPSLFYADWIEPIGEACPRVAALRAELLALPAISRCVEDARSFRLWFPPGAPERD